MNLRSAGYECITTTSGIEALRLAREQRPVLALLEVILNDLDGYELTQRLRHDARTIGCGIIMLTSKSMSSDKVLGLAAGADDYIVKPFDPVELLARVKGTLRRLREMRSASPLTGLPGNLAIRERIQRALTSGEEAALIYVDIDNFKAYNDTYGFVAGDEVIEEVGTLLVDAIVDLPKGFVGHVGGDDFLIVTPVDRGEFVAQIVIERFSQQVSRYYGDEDVAHGFIQAWDREGNRRRFPLMSLSIGVTTTRSGRFRDERDAIRAATHMKTKAKLVQGSAYRVDARSASRGP